MSWFGWPCNGGAEVSKAPVRCHTSSCLLPVTTWVIFHVALLCLLPRPVSVMNFVFLNLSSVLLLWLPLPLRPISKVLWASLCNQQQQCPSETFAHLTVSCSTCPRLTAPRLPECCGLRMRTGNCALTRTMVLHQSRTSLLELVLTRVLFIHREALQLKWET